MKFIHNELLYDTSVADRLVSYTYNYRPGIGSIEVVIYKTKSGKYFYLEGLCGREKLGHVAGEGTIKRMLSDIPELYLKVFPESVKNA